MRHHRSAAVPHPFTPDPSVRALSERTEPCGRCGMYRSNRIHTEYVAPETDDSRILGERGNDADAA